MKILRFQHWLVCCSIVLCSEISSAQDLTAIAGSGPEQEREAVVATLDAYLDVVDKKRKSAIREAFHPIGVLMSVSQAGGLRVLTQDDWWERVARIPENAPARESSIILIDVSGHAAVARIDITNGATGRTTTDYFNLQKTNDGWRIVNKTLSEPL